MNNVDINVDKKFKENVNKNLLTAVLRNLKLILKYNFPMVID